MKSMVRRWRKSRNSIRPESGGYGESLWIIANTGVKLRIKTIKSQDPGCSDEGPQLAIFFLHGVGGSADVWAAQMSFFSRRGYTVYAPDMIGHGFSQGPKDPSLYSFSSICSNLVEIFDALCKDVNVVVGHSYGTSFASNLAMSRGSRIHKLVLMSGGAPVALAPSRGIFTLPNSVLSCLAPALSRLFNRYGFHRDSKCIPNKESAFDVPSYVLSYIMRGQVWPEGDEELHKRITQQTLLLHGVDDSLEHVDNTYHMNEVLQHSELFLLKKCGHMIMMEQPFLVNSIIAKFLGCEFSSGIRVSTEVLHYTPKRSRRISLPANLTKSQPSLQDALHIDYET